jgi:hypothetical protein
MSRSRVDAVANAVLYEGYALYPYRPTSVKSRRRFNFGVLAPKAAVEHEDRGYLWQLRTECVVQGDAGTVLSVVVRFLQLTPRRPDEAAPSIAEPWLEATERSVVLPPTTLDALTDHPGARQTPFAFDDLSGRATWSAVRLAADGYRVSVSVGNTTPLAPAQSLAHNDLLPVAFVSTHAILTVAGGAFVSMLDPPDEWRTAVAGCTNAGVWPVLAGAPGQRDVMLASPIILYDYPEVSAESPGDLFDGAEIDEILTLRILTLTDAEKDEMRRADARTRELLERTESLTPEHMRRLHGVMHGARDPRER